MTTFAVDGYGWVLAVHFCAHFKIASRMIGNLLAAEIKFDKKEV